LKRALFLDRDGTILVDPGYPRDPEAVRFIDGAELGLRVAQDLGFALVVVSNQSGVARGIIQPAEAKAVHDRMVGLLGQRDITLAGSYYCFHGPDDGCRCRKPEPGMLEDAARDLGLDLPSSVMLGDRRTDIVAGKRAGARAVLLGATIPEADFCASTWGDVVAYLAKHAAEVSP
jgi:D-glycero-D-manno-heptose 1,7-bisphosphate phosphatase